MSKTRKSTKDFIIQDATKAATVIRQLTEQLTNQPPPDPPRLTEANTREDMRLLSQWAACRQPAWDRAATDAREGAAHCEGDGGAMQGSDREGPVIGAPVHLRTEGLRAGLDRATQRAIHHKTGGIGAKNLPGHHQARVLLPPHRRQD